MLLVGLILSSYTLSLTLAASCDGSTWSINYNGHNCDYNNGEYTVKCQSKSNAGQCGMRLDGIPRLGTGTYSATIKATPGDGTNTAFYLYSYGRNNDQNSPWNEIDIEILGKQIGGQTRIFTNLWTGFKQQHYEFITVPWDASNSYHTYTIKIDNSNIYWIFDGQTYRTVSYTGYSDVVSTINNNDFQAEISLWGTNGEVWWPDMGLMSNNNNNFPLKAYFKNVVLNSGSGGDPNCSKGIRNGNVCCSSQCGICGGSGCSSRTGGAHSCCYNTITSDANNCKYNYAPCLIM